MRKHTGLVAVILQASMQMLLRRAQWNNMSGNGSSHSRGAPRTSGPDGEQAVQEGRQEAAYPLSRHAQLRVALCP